MSVERVDVFLHLKNEKIALGILAIKDTLIYFEYDDSFIQRNLEISPYKLPLKRGLHMCDDKIFEGLFGVFGDSLPDGWGRLLLDRHFLRKGVSYSDISPLDRLSYGEHSTTYLGEGKNPSSKHLLDLAKKHAIKDAQMIIDSIKRVIENFDEYAKKYTTPISQDNFSKFLITSKHVTL
ncbi:MAG: HipA N-terminal domain-containing protein [Sulfurimonas sp.]|nr:HipA N-terminal domain-containing protein [Sulfurimonas sp.]